MDYLVPDGAVCSFLHKTIHIVEAGCWSAAPHQLHTAESHLDISAQADITLFGWRDENDSIFIFQDFSFSVILKPSYGASGGLDVDVRNGLLAGGH